MGFNGGNVEIWTSATGTTNTPWTFDNYTWHHITVVGDATSMNIYLDGELAVTGGGTANYGTSIFPVNIGGGGIWNASGNWFLGQIDDVRIYNHALSEQEILGAMEGAGEVWPNAYGPVPVDGSLVPDIRAKLSWIPGASAVSHNVYFGENFTDVESGTGGTFRGNQTEDWFLVGSPGHPYPDGLTPDTTYYWRIDEVGVRSTIHTGNVWSFSTARVGVLWLDSTETMVFQPQNGGAWYPRLLELANGDWLCVYDTNYGGGSKIICLSRSTNKGESWSYLSQASFGVGLAANGQLTQLPNGYVLCAYRLVNEPTKTLKVSRSMNNGQTWQHLSTIISNTEGVWEPHIIRKVDGELLVFYAQEATPPQVIEMQRSHDDGQSWHSPQIISRASWSRDGMPVPAILNDGDILVVLEGSYNAGEKFSTISVRSSDGGDTWGPRRLVYAPENRNYGAAAPYVVQMHTGEIIAAFQTNEVSPHEQAKMGIVISWDDGNTWISQPRPFADRQGDHFVMNSLFVQDSRTIVAATTCWGKIKMIKGILHIPGPIQVPEEYAKIQDAVDAAWEDNTIIVAPGIYNENISFQDRNIVLISTDPNDAAVVANTVIQPDGMGSVVTFSSSEDASCVLAGFTITGGNNGIYCSGASPTITNCSITGNIDAGIELRKGSNPTITKCCITTNSGAGIELWAEGSGRLIIYNYPTITNCTIAGNLQHGISGGIPTITNSIIWANSSQQIADTQGSITYSDVQGGWAGEGNIDADPYFAYPNNGDYHLKSQAGRWDMNSQSWLIDDVTSLCIDAGDPNSDWTAELWPHGKRINMGAYGGTPQASMSLSTVADPLSEALDTALSFTTGGSADWFVQNTTSYYDGDAAQSGDISGDQESWMQTRVSGKGTVKFYWKVSSENSFDFLEFYINGELQDRISGTVDWQQKTYTITTSGSHTLRWRYTKDRYVISGSDCGWIDKVEWTPIS